MPCRAIVVRRCGNVAGFNHGATPHVASFPATGCGTHHHKSRTSNTSRNTRSPLRVISSARVPSHWRTRAALARLNDRLLRDIGLSVLDADREIRKWFWQP